MKLFKHVDFLKITTYSKLLSQTDQLCFRSVFNLCRIKMQTVKSKAVFLLEDRF